MNGFERRTELKDKIRTAALKLFAPMARIKLV